MQNAWRIGIGAAVVVAAIVLFLVLRQSDETSATAPTTSTPTETAGATDTAPSDTGAETAGDTSPTTTPSEPENPTFTVDVPEGGPSEIQELDVRQGQRVTIVVTLPDHWNVHLHGYDLLLHTGPGLPPARFRFRASTPGRFELEIEDTGKQIAELRVAP